MISVMGMIEKKTEDKKNTEYQKTFYISCGAVKFGMLYKVLVTPSKNTDMGNLLLMGLWELWSKTLTFSNHYRMDIIALGKAHES